MKIRTCLLVAALAAMGCGGSSGTNDGGPPAECISCIAQNCNSQAKVVFGSGYQNNNFTGGVCPKFMSCKNDSQLVCAQQDGPSCETAFNTLVACLDQTTCFNSACKSSGGGGGNTASGLSVSGNAMDYGNMPVGSSQYLCKTVTGANAQTMISQQITGCVSSIAGTSCPFSNMPLYCSTTNSCDVCVTFAPKSDGTSTATLSIVPGLTVYLSGIGYVSTTAGTGGTAGKQCPPAGCITCYQQFCNNEAVAAFGPNYVNSNFSGGACPNLKNCACADGNPAVCAQQAGASCVAAFGTLSNCATANCYGTCNSGESNGGSGGTGGITGAGGKVGTGGATVPSGAGGIGGQTTVGTVTFVNGVGIGVMTGWGWIASGLPDVVTDPLCGGAVINTAAPCSVKPSWNSPSALCMSGTIPALPATPTQADYDSNWGMEIGISSGGNPPAPIGKSYSTIAIAVTGSPVTGLRVQLHRNGDPSGLTYCAPYTNTPIPFTVFNTACWNGSGVQLTLADVPLIDNVMLFAPSTQWAITVTNLCITGITFGGNTGADAGIGAGGNTGVDGGVVITGTGGISGTGGVIGTGGTTTPVTGLACPLGTWVIDYGATTCGNTTAVITITQALGQYYVSMVAGPLQHWSSATGTNYCDTQVSASLSATYVGNVFEFTFGMDSDTCPNKKGTLTLSINSACTQAGVKMVVTHCSGCDSQGKCLSCETPTSSMTCTTETGVLTAVHST